MSPLHLAAALLIVAMWGLNFTVIRFGLDEFTPFAFATWRFLLGALPALFIPRPNVSWTVLAGIGGLMFAGQFVFLFFAMQAGLPPGLTSVLVQLQGPLTVVLARDIEDFERIHRTELSRLPRVARLESSFALREVVNRAVPPSVFGKTERGAQRRRRAEA